MAAAKPATRKRSGPPANFRIIEQPPELLFGVHGRQSPYLLALQQLCKAGPGRVLEFDRVRARAQIYVQARKHNIKVMFAEQDGKLFVRLLDVDGPLGLVLNFLSDGPRTMADIAAHLVSLGIEHKDHAGLMSDLSRNDRIKLETVNGTKKWVRIKG